jgi:DNA invertase Pin-like site-specific DNA recombinase
MEACLRMGLEIESRPLDYTPFWNDDELKRQLWEEMFEKIKDKFVVIEQQSWLKPYERKRWRNIIKWIEKWKIKWLLSYSPDRQARNLLEAWELIDMVDQNLVDLKYTNFHFEPNASGKMMLWVRFVLSKQYSDKLSEDVSRGKKSTIGKGKADGKFKHGYMINEEWFHTPHPTDFALWRRAFEMKIYENQSDDAVYKYLISSGYKRKYKNKETKLNVKSIYRVWKDSFYYGIFQSGNNEVDLKEKNPYFEPMITEEEFWTLLRKHYANWWWIMPNIIKLENEETMPFPRGMVVTKDNYPLTHNLPNKKRFEKKLAELQVTKHKATLWDIVLPHQISYKDANKSSPTKWLWVTAEFLIDKMIECIKHFTITKEVWDEYVVHMESKLEDIQKKRNEKRREFQLHYNKIKWEKDDLISNSLAKRYDKEQEEMYQKQRAEYDTMLNTIKRNMEALEASERDIILELDSFVSSFHDNVGTYKKGNYVRKRKFAELLISNIIIINENTVEIKPKEGLEHLFSSGLQSGETRTHDLQTPSLEF